MKNIKITCSEIRVFVNSKKLWKEIFLEKKWIPPTRSLIFGKIAHNVIRDVVQGRDFHKALKEQETKEGITLFEREILRISQVLKRIDRRYSNGEFVLEPFLSLSGRVDLMKDRTPVELKFGKRTIGDIFQVGAYSLCLNTQLGEIIYPDYLFVVNLDEIRAKLLSYISEIKEYKKVFFGGKNALP